MLTRQIFKSWRLPCIELWSGFGRSVQLFAGRATTKRESSIGATAAMHEPSCNEQHMSPILVMGTKMMNLSYVIPQE